MAKIKIKDVEKRTKRDYNFNDLTLHSGMFKDVKKFDIGEEIEVTVKVKITSLRLADSWELEEYKGINKDTEFARAQVISVTK